MNFKTMLCGLLVFAAAAACTPQDEPVVTPKLDVSGSSVTLTATGAEGTFTVTSNQKWTASADASWVVVTPASGDASDKAVTVKVTAEDNTATEARTATVTVKAGDLSKTVSVSQACAEAQTPETPEDPETPEEPETPAEPEPDPTPVPEIPAGYVATTLWEGSKDLTWSAGMQDLAYGGYNWSQRKVGEYIKAQFNPTDPAAVWMIGVMYANADYAWEKVPALPDSYYKPVDGVVTFELTEDVLALFVSPNNGLIFHGENITITKVEVYSDPNAAEEPATGNLVANGDFESGAAGWMGWSWGPFTQDLDAGRDGGQSIVLTLGACTNLWDAQIVQDIVALEAGTYAYEFYAKSTVDSHLVQLFAQETKNYQGIYGGEHLATTEWTLFTGELVFDGSIENLNRVGIQFGKADAEGAKVWIDDVKLEKKN